MTIYSGFSHWKMVIFHSFLYVYQRIIMGRAGSYEKNLRRAAPGWGTLPEPGQDHVVFHARTHRDIAESMVTYVWTPLPSFTLPHVPPSVQCYMMLYLLATTWYKLRLWRVDIPLSAYATIMLYPYRRNLIWSHLCLISTLSHRETHLTLGGSRVLCFYPWWDHRTSCAEGIVWNRSNRFGVGPQCHSCPSIFAQFLLLKREKTNLRRGGTYMKQIAVWVFPKAVVIHVIVTKEHISVVSSTVVGCKTERPAEAGIVLPHCLPWKNFATIFTPKAEVWRSLPWIISRSQVLASGWLPPWLTWQMVT